MAYKTIFSTMELLVKELRLNKGTFAEIHERLMALKARKEELERGDRLPRAVRRRSWKEEYVSALGEAQNELFKDGHSAEVEQRIFNDLQRLTAAAER